MALWHPEKLYKKFQRSIFNSSRENRVFYCRINRYWYMKYIVKFNDLTIICRQNLKLTKRKRNMMSLMSTTTPTLMITMILILMTIILMTFIWRTLMTGKILNEISCSQSYSTHFMAVRSHVNIMWWFSPSTRVGYAAPDRMLRYAA